ncbi:hypothetical protein IMZ08_03885 [Bacillus luteolus]|uniref:Uncharacterized protein n=1 Tax=Litchfieldia luteola TaxID=682179 RepID=A0ABR9QFG0_9BACI|nr:hypothetical protein [Cytobacillus luteolus]MBE4907198.1 hypothetical protein [Cytobacillus luteolus]MBP1943328.1 hypothetical protein [Cytobacillus luteolus]
MNKVLFFNNEGKAKLLNVINEILRTKNRLLMLILTNPDKKTNVATRNKKQSKYEEQIIVLENIKQLVESCSTREDLESVNNMIRYYNTLS